MNPSHVRQRILADHERLRARLDQVELALAAMHTDPSRLADVLDVANTLLAELCIHTEIEDAVLGQALLEADAWGPIRARLLREHHAEQRSQLKSLLEAYRRPQSVESVAHMTLGWIRGVRADMHHEEHDLLTTALLRDDLVAVSMEAG